MIYRVERVDGQARVTTDEEQVLRGGWRDIKSWRMIGRLVGIKAV